MRAHIFHNLGGKVCPRVVHREDDSLDIQTWIEPLPDEIDRVDQLAQSLKRIIFTLDRNQHRVRSRHGIDRQDTQRGRAVQEYEIIIVADKIQGIPQNIFLPLNADQLNLRSRQIDIGCDQIQIRHNVRNDRLIHRTVVQQQFIDRVLLVVFVHAETAGRIPLRIHIDNKDLFI